MRDMSSAVPVSTASGSKLSLIEQHKTAIFIVAASFAWMNSVRISDAS
jgi:hypothetical protein